MRKKQTLSLLLVPMAMVLFCCMQCSDLVMLPPENPPSGMNLLPAAEDASAVVSHKAFTLEYSEKHEQARWVAYLMTREYASGNLSRTNDFREDPSIATGSATLNDYRKSGYTRGHLCPAGDMKWDETAMSETFLLSNMSPQLSDFNDGIWNKMESKVRYWAKIYDSLYVVTGPVLKEGLPTIGENRVSVPEEFYKIIYDPKREEAICFLVPHRKSDKGIRMYVVSIDRVEELTGIDFFPELPDEIEERVECQCNIEKWKWGK